MTSGKVTELGLYFMFSNPPRIQRDETKAPRLMPWTWTQSNSPSYEITQTISFPCLTFCTERKVSKWNSRFRINKKS